MLTRISAKTRLVLAAFAITLYVDIEGLVEADAAEQEAACAHQQLVARDASSPGVERRAAPLRDEAVAKGCDDGEATVDAEEDDDTVQDEDQVPVFHGLANSNVSGAKLEVNEAAVVAHFPRDLVANVRIVGVRVVRNHYLGGRVGEQKWACWTRVQWRQ